MTDFATMTSAEQNELATKISACLRENGHENIPVKTVRQEICSLKKKDVESTNQLMVSKDFPAADAEKADKLNAALKTITEGIANVEISIVSKIGAGDPYKTITKVEKTSNPGEAVDLAHTAGEVWLLDFWATWCPPCQGPMAHNVKMLEENKDAWGGKVRIIGLSIDKDSETVNKHVEAKGWGNVEHYWRAQSDCSKVYGVSGVPHVMLIDTEGKIVFKGHPAGRPDLAADMTQLLKGVPLEGDGVAAAAGNPAEQCKEQPAPAVPQGFEEVDAEKINKEMDEFRVVAKKMQEQIGEGADNLMRDFCVSVFQTQLMADGKCYGKYENHRVLVGAKDKIEECNKMIKENVTGSFKVQEQVIER